MPGTRAIGQSIKWQFCRQMVCHMTSLSTPCSLPLKTAIQIQVVLRIKGSGMHMDSFAS